MKASELIAELTKLMGKHGDLPVRFNGGHADCEIEEINVYDDIGASPYDEYFDKPYEFFLDGYYVEKQWSL